MSEQAPGRQNQRLHRVRGGARAEPGAAAYSACKAKTQKPADSAPMRYFVVHLHRLLDPESPGRAVR